MPTRCTRSDPCLPKCGSIRTLAPCASRGWWVSMAPAILNAKTARSQLIGGMVWGIGMAQLEDTVVDHRSGRIVNASLAEYLVPVEADVPDLDASFVEEHDPYVNPLGAKGIGEVGIPALLPRSPTPSITPLESASAICRSHSTSSWAHRHPRARCDSRSAVGRPVVPTLASSHGLAPVTDASTRYGRGDALSSPAVWRFLYFLLSELYFLALRSRACRPLAPPRTPSACLPSGSLNRADPGPKWVGSTAPTSPRAFPPRC